MPITGTQAKEALARELGYEVNRARLVAEAAARSDVATYWQHAGLPIVEDQTLAAIAKVALMPGTQGRSRLLDAVTRALATTDAAAEANRTAEDLAALAIEHQSLVNMSRNRASWVNAHLTVLDSQGALQKTYEPLISPGALRDATEASAELNRRVLHTAGDLAAWISDTHMLLSGVSDSAAMQSSPLAEETEDVRAKRGVIARKAIGTYGKQWEMYVLEKLGPEFSLATNPEDFSPLTGRIDAMAKRAARSWESIAANITEMKSSAQFMRRVGQAESKPEPSTPDSAVCLELEWDGRAVRIEFSAAGVTASLIASFLRAARAQFLIYSGSGPFAVVLRSGSAHLSIHVQDAKRADIDRLEKMLPELANPEL